LYCTRAECLASGAELGLLLVSPVISFVFLHDREDDEEESAQPQQIRYELTLCRNGNNDHSLNSEQEESYSEEGEETISSLPPETQKEYENCPRDSHNAARQHGFDDFHRLPFRLIPVLARIRA
jgi:hypothetical protein